MEIKKAQDHFYFFEVKTGVQKMRHLKRSISTYIINAFNVKMCNAISLDYSQDNYKVHKILIHSALWEQSLSEEHILDRISTGKWHTQNKIIQGEFSYKVMIYRCVGVREGFPGGASGKESTCQCNMRLGFDPWGRNIP